MKLSFPKGFFWGAASASYQVEGGIDNTDWAYEARTSKKVPIADSGPDHYNRFEEDFDLAKKLGHNAHRFSLEWARIEPAEGEFSAEAIRHYKQVIRALKARGITPFVTLWHFTLPKWLYVKGGAEAKDFPEHFAKYAAYVAEHLGSDVEHWVTMNEPVVFTGGGWLRGQWPPFKRGRIDLVLRVLNNLAKAHNAAYIRMKEKDLTGEVGVVKNNIYFHATNKNPLNRLKARIMQYCWNFYFLNKVVAHTDTIGLNYYFHSPFGPKPVCKKSDMNWDLYPEGLYHVLMELKQYKKPVFIAEAGIADERDVYRAEYIHDLVYWTHRAIDDGVPVKGFMYWSLTDNFEWALGYDKRFGLIAIDYKTKKRTVRNSAYAYKEICLNNAVDIGLKP
jgi:beta-glucosidase